MNGDCTTGAPTPLHSPRHCCLLANRDRCMVAAARRRLLFDCCLDSRQRRAAWREWLWVIGIRCHSQKNIAQYPIHPNTSIVRTLVTKVNLSFSVHLHNYNKQQLILAKFYTNNASFIGTQSTKFQLNLPTQTTVTAAFVRSPPKHFSFRSLCLVSSANIGN